MKLVFGASGNLRLHLPILFFHKCPKKRDPLGKSKEKVPTEDEMTEVLSEGF
jgi:hypothetical protein